MAYLLYCPFLAVLGLIAGIGVLIAAWSAIAFVMNSPILLSVSIVLLVAGLIDFARNR